jgi:hypothetical protein
MTVTRLPLLLGHALHTGALIYTVKLATGM